MKITAVIMMVQVIRGMPLVAAGSAATAAIRVGRVGLRRVGGQHGRRVVGVRWITWNYY